MSIGSISDVLSQISTIEGQIQQLESGSLLDPALGVDGSSSTTSSATSSATGSAASATGFSDALAEAQGSTDTDADEEAASADGSYGALDSSALDSSALDSSAIDSSALASGALGATVVATGGAALPSSASTLLTSGQQQFASTLSADTGLNPSVVSAWLLSEESGGAAQSRQAAGNNDWLNIGYTGSGTYGADDAVWSDPTTAANATAQWLQGQASVSGYGTASTGIQSILASVGQTPQVQIAALQDSGWSSSGYPDLASTYAQVSGSQA